MHTHSRGCSAGWHVQRLYLCIWRAFGVPRLEGSSPLCETCALCMFMCVWQGYMVGGVQGMWQQLGGLAHINAGIAAMLR